MTRPTMNKLNWEAISNGDRNQTINKIKEMLLTSNGSLLNFTMFSDLAINFTVEIEEYYIMKLHNKLSRVLSVSDFDSEDFDSNSDSGWKVYLHISFSKGKGVLKHKIPSVPG
ncbi:MAG: hypothetical protein P8M34_14775 [Saprospiraceae bacterium]|nr:hypothetical protein [Saprospiraceae bacterium]|tara:strand:+ start:160 stop:498 length:339 start_codon:yes stop_codon:yes gene_type:complete